MEKTSLNQNTLPLRETPRIQKLGAYLKKLRLELGLSLRDVAGQTDLSPGYISKIENGAIKKTIGIESLVSLANMYEIPVEVILAEAQFTAKTSYDLPPLSMYLKIKYKFPPQAIRDLEIAKEIVERKYKNR
jgi:transcriptional regulator with XRE-family HTH domain